MYEGTVHLHMLKLIYVFIYVYISVCIRGYCTFAYATAHIRVSMCRLLRVYACALYVCICVDACICYVSYVGAYVLYLFFIWFRSVVCICICICF